MNNQHNQLQAIQNALLKTQQSNGVTMASMTVGVNPILAKLQTIQNLKDKQEMEAQMMKQAEHAKKSNQQEMPKISAFSSIASLLSTGNGKVESKTENKVSENW